MNKILIMGVMGLIPVSILAEINVNFSINSGCNTGVVREVEYIAYGEPWFDGHICEGSSRISFEYQWSHYGSDYVLRYRKVTFNTFSNAWVFGAWNVKEVCRGPVSKIHIKRASHPDWRRVYNSRTRTYYYEYRNNDHRDGRKVKVYRYEYRPQHKKVHVTPEKKVHNKKEHVNKRHSGSDKRIIVKKEKKNHVQSKQGPHNHKSKNHKGSEKKITKISGRN
ncbi:MAG: hypothetical protein GXY77_17775 [Fibrobacter sp.]|nr:hypothetical protein [Fibrobacter sp.]